MEWTSQIGRGCLTEHARNRQMAQCCSGEIKPLSQAPSFFLRQPGCGCHCRKPIWTVNMLLGQTQLGLRIWRSAVFVSVSACVGHMGDVRHGWTDRDSVSVGPKNRVYEMGVQLRHGEGQFWGETFVKHWNSVPDMELGHWVTGSVGHLGRVWCPGHRVIIFDPVWDPSFSGFWKKPKIKI